MVSSKAPVGVPGSEVISPENVEVVAGFKTKVDGIREVLARDNMKVVFFGRSVECVKTDWKPISSDALEKR